VLSKLRYGGTESRPTGEVEQDLLTSDLRSLFGTNLAGLTPVPGGTLGVGFKANLNGQARFFKTHALPSGRLTLKREAEFLKVTALAQTDPQLVHRVQGSSERTWLHTRLLSPCASPSPPSVRALIAEYEAQLRKHPELAGVVPASDSIHELLARATPALDFLAGANLLSPLVTDTARAALDRLQGISADLSLQLCHGDLGPANIMSDGGSLVALDWEDAFWGIAGYDYLYWLTFFQNRKWLSKAALGHTPLEPSQEIALMALILLLKSWMSVRNGSYLCNTLTIEQRLLEVFNLD
ncbi:putative O antigen biosynthesis protein, partial [Bordetella avium 197N]